MGGGLMQLVAYGAQDIYLTGNPQITFFKVEYIFRKIYIRLKSSFKVCYYLLF